MVDGGGGVLLIHSGQKPGIPLNTLQRTGQPPIAKNYLAPNVIAKMGKTYLELYSFAFVSKFTNRPMAQAQWFHAKQISKHTCAFFRHWKRSPSLGHQREFQVVCVEGGEWEGTGKWQGSGKKFRLHLSKLSWLANSNGNGGRQDWLWTKLCSSQIYNIPASPSELSYWSLPSSLVEDVTL